MRLARAITKAGTDRSMNLTRRDIRTAILRKDHPVRQFVAPSKWARAAAMTAGCACTLAVAFACVESTRAQTPASALPGANQASSGAKVPIARYFPKDGMRVYVEFEGLSAHATAWNKSATAKILTETKTGAMLEEIFTQLFRQVAPGMAAAEAPDATAFTAPFKQIAQNGLAIGVMSDPAKPGAVMQAMVFQGAFRPEVRTFYAGFLKGLSPPGSKTEAAAKPGGRKVATVHRPDNTTIAWWIERREDLVVADPAWIDGIIARLDGKEAGFDTSSTRAELTKVEQSFEPILTGFVELGGFLPPLPPQLAPLGIESLRRIDLRWGVQNEAVVTDLRLIAPSPRKGIFAIFDQPTFNNKSLPPMPGGIESFAALSLDPAKVYGEIVDFMRGTGSTEAVDDFEKLVKARTKMAWKDDILAKLGPKMSVLIFPGKTAAKADPEKASGVLGSLGSALASAGSVGQVPKLAILIETKDAKTLAKPLDELILIANRKIKAALAAPGEAPEATRSGSGRGRSTAKKSAASTSAPEFRLTSTGSNQPKSYSLNLPTAYAALTNARPVIALGKSHLIIATSADAAKTALAFDDKPKAEALAGKTAEAVEAMPDGLIALSVFDNSEEQARIIANLPKELETQFAALADNPALAGLPAGGAGGAAQPPAGSPGAGFNAPLPNPGGVGGGGDPEDQLKSRQRGRGTAGPGTTEEDIIQQRPRGGKGKAGAGAGLQSMPPQQVPGRRGAARAPQDELGTASGDAPPKAPMPNNPGAPASGSAPAAMNAVSPLLAFKNIRFSVDPAKIPKADDVKKHLFPTAIALSVTDQGIRVFMREPFLDLSGNSSMLGQVQKAMLGAASAGSQRNQAQAMPPAGGAPGQPPGGRRGGGSGAVAEP